jgi:hypothetical protein
MKPTSNFANAARAYDQGAVHSPRLRAYVEIGRRARAKHGESEGRRRARKNYRAWRRRHAARDAHYWTRRHALDQLSGAMGGTTITSMIEAMIRHRELRDQRLTRRQRPVFEALLALERLHGTLD